MLLKQIDAIWQEASAAFARLDDEQLAAPIGGSDWCAKDMMAHFARWEDWHREAITEYLVDGSTRSYKGFSSWNDGWAAEDRRFGLRRRPPAIGDRPFGANGATQWSSAGAVG